MTEELQDYFKRVIRATEDTLDELLPHDGAYPENIHAVMRYSTFAGGKRVRPALVMAAYEACGGTFGDQNVRYASAAIEMLHTFSLMHDDLPCMDDDDFRRGKPTAHRAFNEALAVLGGDALCIFAFEVLSRTGRIDLIQEIAQSLGTNGMIGGQVVDIESEGKRVDQKIIEYIHINKTAKLIRASVRTGALLANATKQQFENLSTYGLNVGLAFQIVDDILDEEGTTEQLGKDAGSDRERGKATYPAIFGIEQSRTAAKDLIDTATQNLAEFGESGDVLLLLADFIRTRIT
ncbi:MAG: polyprenyl synthetase family protein [Chitinivibrionales bacterium]